MTLGELWTVDFELATDADHYPKSLVTIRVHFRRTQIIIPNPWSFSAILKRVAVSVNSYQNDVH
jgi:hypothetical protein